MTLPGRVLEELQLTDGDQLEAEVVEGKVELRPVSVVGRENTLRRVIGVVDRDRWIGPEPRPSPEEEERWIFDVIAEDEDRRA